MSEVNIFNLKNAKLLSSTNSNLEDINLNTTDQRDPDTDSAWLAGLQLEESMFSPTITGEATIRDYGMGGQGQDAILNNLGLGGYDILELTFETTQVESGLPIPQGSQKAYTFQFLIYAYNQKTSETYSLMANSPVPRVVVLKLASPEFSVMNYLYFDYFNQDEDMILPISKIGTQQNIAGLIESDGVASLQGEGEGEEDEDFIPADPPNTTGMGLEYTGNGMVQFLVDQVNTELANKNLSTVPLLSENTMNWVWLKKDYNFYPWGKMASPPRFNQLVQMLTENAVHEKWKTQNVRAANFFFWRTIDSWNFFSLESLVKRPPSREYNLTADLNQAESIQNLSTSNSSEGLLKSADETDNLALLNSYAFGSNYLFVEPKYQDDPYARFLDSQRAHNIIEIKYDYLRDGIYWSKLDQPNDVKNYIPKALSFSSWNGADAREFSSKISQNRIIDKNYGYFSPGFFNRQSNVSWEYYGYNHSSRQEEALWQTQFDITDLDGERLRWFQKEIKKYVAQKRKEYAGKKNLKEKWKVYKCSICCAGSDLGVTQFTGQFGGFTDLRFQKSFDLRDNLLSTYEIVAAGGFSDVLNYNKENSGKILPFGDGSFTNSGLSLSYDLTKHPYNMKLGEFFSLERDPDNFVKYRFDLEIKRHEKLKEILEKNKEARELRKQKYTDAVTNYDQAYQARNESCENDGCTGYCLCPTEYPETVIIKSDLVKGAHDDLIGHEDKILQQIDPIIEKLQGLKEEFEVLYDKYWSRNAFFFSRNINFPSFLKSENNLLNIKSITRKPIRGSKYEPFATRRPLEGARKLVPGLTGSVDVGSYPIGSPGTNPLSNRTSQGSTCMYPYDVPPYVDDLGYKNSVTSVGSGNNCETSANVYYNRGYDYSEQKQYNSDFWSSFDYPYANFPYTEAGEERPKGPIWYRNWLVNYEITLIKPPCLNRKPPCFSGDCSCDEIKLNLYMHFESFANYKDAEILTQPTQIINYAFTQLSRNCDGCKIQILNAYPASEIKLYHPWAADELPGLCGPGGEFGLEDYKNYKRSASLFKGKPGITGTDSFDYGDLPPHLVLESLESYVRVEFMTPIGTETLQTFPEGFVDTHGSEYFLPYIVLATAGPFGAQAARANISVIGQDPYGFDLAVKKIKNKDDFAGMNLMFADGVDGMFVDEDIISDPNKPPVPDLRSPFGTASSWLKTNQNSLFYKPKDGVADLFVPNGVQDIFRASALERSMPVKTWWDMWVSLPPIAVATFYNRYDVRGVSMNGENSGKTIGGPGVAFYSNGSIVAEPYAWTGGCTGTSPSNCDDDKTWPLFLHPDTEQIITGAFASNAAVISSSEIFQTAEFVTGPVGITTFIPGKTAGILPNDPSNYVYRIAEFPHIFGNNISGLSGPERKQYDSISYPVGTLIWGKDIPATESVQGENGTIIFYDYNFVNYYDISRKTQYGLVQLSSDSMPSLLTLINGIGGETQKIQEYQKWISDRIVDWFQNTIFDNNFSAQFVVLSKQDGGCKGYPCMNPAGFPGISGCPANNPLCKCPCQGTGGNVGKPLSTYVSPGAQMPDEAVLRPDLMDMVDDRIVGVTFAPTGDYYWGPEPSSLELKILEKQISECDIIKAHPKFGETWLGCVWDDPNSNYNCSCPNIGKNFPTYMKYNRTHSTFWSTPLEAPLYRTAQMALFNANKITIDVPGDFYVVTGDVVKINAPRIGVGAKRFAGKWIVSTIKHFFMNNVHTMRMVLSRELPHPNPEGILDE